MCYPLCYISIPYVCGKYKVFAAQTHAFGIMAGEVYGGPGYLRMNLGCPRTKLAEGIKRMKKGLGSLI